MSLTPDQILDRVNLKKQLSKYKVLTIFAIVVAIFAVFSDAKVRSISSMESEYIARIFIEGPIYDDMERLQHLADLAEDASVKAVVLHVNSPGGTVVAGESLHYSLKRLAAKKPLVVVMRDMAASAGYMISVAADHIVAHQGTITGSIGVIAQSFELTDLANRIGVQFHNFKSSPLKGGPIPTEKLSPQMEASMNSTISNIYEMFLNIVSSSRNIPLEMLRPIADGRAYTGIEALELGLIDQIGDESNAVEWLNTKKGISSKIKIHEYKLENPSSKLDKFINSSASALDFIKTALYSKMNYFF